MHQSTANNAAPSAGSLLNMPDENGTNSRRHRSERRRSSENHQSFGFAPPSREPSPGALLALVALALCFAIALALYAVFDTATRTAFNLPSVSGLSR